ncbi:hypothetical protein N9544_05315 [Flavobacteriales bacterium]|nr:hypothetical protein [Flavobacteriales bacterium]
MDKTSLYFLFVAALFGGILCDRYIGTSFPFITLILLAMAGVIFYVVTKNLPSDEEE